MNSLGQTSMSAGSIKQLALAIGRAPALRREDAMKNPALNPNGRSHINRRAFLRGAGGVAIALLFEGYLERSAFGALPTNLVFAFFIRTANGVVQMGGSDPEKFWPMALGPIDTANLSAATDRCTSLLAEHVAPAVRQVDQLSERRHRVRPRQRLAQTLNGWRPPAPGNKAVSTARSSTPRSPSW